MGQRLLWVAAVLLVLLVLVDVSDSSSRGRGGKPQMKESEKLKSKMDEALRVKAVNPKQEKKQRYEARKKQQQRTSEFRVHAARLAKKRLPKKELDRLDALVEEYERKRSLENTYFLDSQNSWINTMNTEEHRKRLMDTMLGSPDIYINHWYINPKDDKDPNLGHMLRAFQDNGLHDLATPPRAFTVAVSTKESYAHFVAFVFFPATRTLHYMDPGRGKYDGGLSVKNRVVDQFAKLLNAEPTVVDDTVEVNGCMQCSGDSFCQTWTLLYIFSYFRNSLPPPSSDTDHPAFRARWESYTCAQRECLIRTFIVAILDYRNYANGEMDDVLSDIDGTVNDQFRKSKKEGGYGHADVPQDPWQILRFDWGFPEDEHVPALPNGDYMPCKASNYQ